MKIGDSPKTAYATGIARLGKSSTAPKAKKTAAPANADKIVLFGIPENELTPRVRKAVMSLLEDVQDLREQLAQAQKSIGELQNLADRDPMLDMLNRRAFVRELDRALAMVDRYHIPASLVFIDLNDLKVINDTMGHGAGDAALAHVGKTITKHIRQTDVVGRLGGDEFGLLLVQAGREVAEKKAAELSTAISQSPVAFNGKSFQAKIAWGAIEIERGISLEQAMENADTAMYRAKQQK